MAERADNRPNSLNLDGWGPPVVFLAVVVFCGLLTSALAKLPRPLDHRVDKELFSAGRALRSLEHLLGSEGAHPSGSLAAERVRTHLAAELLRKGWQPEEQVLSLATTWATGTVHNWTVEIEGRDPDAGWIMLLAHTDSVAAGPGVADDLSGVALVIEAARALCARGQPERGLLLVFTDAEEDGLCGAEAFAAQDPRLGDVLCVLNVEARGCRGPSIMFQTGPRSSDLLRAYAENTERPFADSLSVEAYRRMPNDTDLSVFIERQLPGLNFAFIEGHEAYHTPIDDLDHLSLASLQHQGDQFLAGLVAAQEAQFGEPAGSQLVWTALGSRTLFVLRAGTLQVLAFLLLLLTVLGLYQHMQREENQECKWTGALLAWPLWMFLLLLAAMAPGRIMGLIAGVRDPGHTQPFLFWFVSVAAVLALTGAVVFPIVRRVGLASALGACHVWQSVLLCALAIGAPGAGAWLLGVVAFGTLGIWAALVRRGPSGLQGASFWLLGPALILVLPLVNFLAAAYGSGGPQVPMALFLVVGLPALVGLTSLSPGRSLQLAVGAGIVCLSGSIVLLLLPIASEEFPRRQNIVLVSEDGETVKRRGAGEFEVTWDEAAFTPRFVETSRTKTGDGVRIGGVLAGGGPWGSARFEGLREIQLGGRELDGETTSFFALPLAGIEVGFLLGEEPAKIELTLQTPLERLGVDADLLRKPFHMPSGHGDRLISSRTVFEQGQEP
ncbi:MAG TPA: M20/M25/M40 family metallo-hydrolase [Planctomycetes bacterium]|nr:M20/M25/M40 family metallo-hydrolase [Planctomycetota bacterium]HIL37591.1 M20/M25/M40 family metallo-hydrolase [Planctomycetota bacterium]